MRLRSEVRRRSVLHSNRNHLREICGVTLESFVGMQITMHEELSTVFLWLVMRCLIDSELLI